MINKLLTAGLITIFSSGGLAQPENYKFNHLDSRDGLSQGYVVCAFQDSRGFMWFGTQDGLNRYDGYNFKIYKHVPHDSTSLSENWIWNIFEDSRGYIWCGTFGGGACRFDRNTETFKTFRNNPDDSSSLSHSTVWSFYESSNSVLWIGTNNALNQFHPETESFSHYPIPGKSSIVFRILPVKTNKLIITSIDDAFIFDVTTKTYQAFNYNPANLYRIKSVRTNIFKDLSGRIWMGSEEDGIFKYNPNDNSVVNYRHDPFNPDNSLISSNILSIIRDQAGLVWAATPNGLSVMRFSGDELISVQNIYNDPADQTSLSGNYLSNIYESRSGEIWISARDALNRFDQNNQKFQHYNSSPNKSSSLSHNSVLPILASKSNPGIIWIGTYNGLNKFNESTGLFTHFKRLPSNSLSSNYILSLYEDKKGNLWVGTRGGGLCKMEFDNSGNSRFTNYMFDPENPKSLGADNVHYIYEDSGGTLWIGTGGGGLNRMDSENDTFTRFSLDNNLLHKFNDAWAYNMLEDKSGNFWIGTAAGGLNLLDRETESFRYFMNDPNDPNSISSNRILTITELRSGEIWIGTAMGLNKLVKPKNNNEDYSFKQYFEKDGLSNDVIYGILEDEKGYLWISTNDGLCKVSFDGEQMKVRKYSVADGLQSDEFSHNSYSIAPDGKMYFGGVNGFNLFHPDSVKNNPYIPPVVITDFKILNESVPIANSKNILSTNNFLLEKSISETDTITLSYSDDVISFEFAALNFIVPEMNNYAYMMEGFDENWIYSGTRRFVTYTNLDPGKYIFRAKGSNNDGIWNETGTSLTIIITPPIWATWWAYFFYALLCLGVIFIVIKQREKKVKREMEMKIKIDRAKAEERRSVRKKTSQDFHDEAGNKLTKITLFTELVKRELSDNQKIKDLVNHIEENTKELSNGMRDFLWVLDAGKDSLLDAVKRIEDFGNSMFEFTETSFKVTGDDESFKKILLPMEVRRSIILIFKEAMNNCVKYAEAKNVLLQVSLLNELLTLSLIDDGKGFDLNSKSHGYGIQNMQARANKIESALDIKSEAGKGAIITFSGNITHMGD